MVDVQRVKKYNDALKSAKESSSKIDTEISYAKRELERLCAELSTELGEAVTVDNVAEIYTRESEKIERTLNMGEEILARVMGNTGVTQPTAQVGVNNPLGGTVQPQGVPVENVQTAGSNVVDAGISGFDAFSAGAPKQETENNNVSGAFSSLFGNI